MFAPARFGGLSLFTYSTAGPGPAEAGTVDPNLAAAGPGVTGAAAGAQARGSEAEGPTVVADEGAAAEPRSVGGARGVEAVLRPRNAAGGGGSSVDSGVWFAAASGGAVEAAATAAVELGDGSFGTTAGCSVENGQG